jgi:hypothetical protein
MFLMTSLPLGPPAAAASAIAPSSPRVTGANLRAKQRLLQVVRAG